MDSVQKPSRLVRGEATQALLQATRERAPGAGSQLEAQAWGRGRGAQTGCAVAAPEGPSEEATADKAPPRKQLETHLIQRLQRILMGTQGHQPPTTWGPTQDGPSPGCGNGALQNFQREGSLLCFPEKVPGV